MGSVRSDQGQAGKIIGFTNTLVPVKEGLAPVATTTHVSRGQAPPRNLPEVRSRPILLTKITLFWSEELECKVSETLDAVLSPYCSISYDLTRNFVDCTYLAEEGVKFG